MQPKPERPTRTTEEFAGSDVYRETHPAYALAAFSRVSQGGGGATLFGSDFRHGHYMTLRISPADVRRGLSHDWFHAQRIPYIEIALSESAFARLIATPNHGEGVPVTVLHVNGEYVPPIEIDTDRREQFNEEIADTLKDALRVLRMAKELAGQPNLKAADRKALEALVSKGLQEIESNLAFVARSFDKHAEETIDKMKVEVEAYINAAIARAGVTALSGGEAPIALAESTDKEMVLDT